MYEMRMLVKVISIVAPAGVSRILKVGSGSYRIEDLLPAAPVTTLIAKLGDDVALDSTENCSGTWHYRVSKAWKEEAIASLPSHLAKDDPGGMVWLAEEIWRRAEKIANTKANASTQVLPSAPRPNDSKH